MPAPKDPDRREEWIRKQRDSHKGRTTWMKGRKHTHESKQKNRDAHLGKIPTKEHLENMSKALKGRKPWNTGKTNVYSEERLKQLRLEKIGNQYAKGTKHTEEWKRSKSLSQIGEKNPFYNKTHNEETKIRISKINTGNSYRLGKPQSEKTRAKIREARLNQIFPRKDTKPEKILQIALTLRGVDFRKHERIIGQPDVFIEPNLCIFVDGDDVHGNPKKYAPEDEIAFGIIAKARWMMDQKVTMRLIKNGYYVLRIWESDIKQDANKCVDFILKFQKILPQT